MSSSFSAARFPALPIGKGKVAADSLEKHAPTHSESSDDALIARICKDDAEALDLLFRRYSRLVWSIGRRILRNNEEAEDLVQDVFLFLRGRASVFDNSKGTVRSLLVHITYQRAISRRRYLASRAFYASQGQEAEKRNRAEADALPMYDESLEAHFGKERLQTALAELSAEQRETLRLHFFEGYSLEEIADRLGQSYGNVRHYYYRGLEKLRSRAPKLKR